MRRKGELSVAAIDRLVIFGSMTLVESHFSMICPQTTHLATLLSLLDRCVRPLSAVHMTAGHNALRGSGPGH